MATYLFTGTSRGLGLHMVKVLIQQPSNTVKTIYASARSLTPSAELSDLIKSSDDRIVYVPLDVSSSSSISSAVSQVSSHLKSTGGLGLDALINNAGVQYQDGPPSGMDKLAETFDTNVIGVHRVTQAFLPLLEAGQGKKLVNISSTLGSIAMKGYSEKAPCPSYKISKAALNMMSAQYSLELGPKGFTVVHVNPGWNKTDLGSQYADLEPEEGSKAVVDIILGLAREDNGKFKNVRVEGKIGGKFHWNGIDLYDGKDAPW
ncbi:MAG: hypothetical protein MMC23_003064 [Stictis urceolatum]|nr:hypothetical protein [Stictis urceolata]